MTGRLVLCAALLLPNTVIVAQGKPVLVVQPPAKAPGVELPYDLPQLQAQLVAEFRVMLGKEFEVVAEAPATPSGTVYALNATITGWRAGNAAKRFLVGMGSGRESSDIEYHVADPAGTKVVESKDTIRTNFYSQGAGSSGTLAHPIAQKIAERVKKAKLK
jgi:hypothetical protein